MSAANKHLTFQGRSALAQEGLMNEEIRLKYNRSLKSYSRDLRKNMTDAKILLWSHLRGKQILGVRFYRQKPIFNYIVDFYADRAKLVIECDGSQHYEIPQISNDQIRDEYLTRQGIKVLRFDNLQVLHEIDSVMEVIWDMVKQRNPSCANAPLP